MGPVGVVVIGVVAKQPAQMTLARHYHMVQQVPAHGSDDTLHKTVLPRRPWGNRSIPDSHGRQSLSEDSSIGAVTISQQISRGRFPGESLHDLACYPLGRRMVRRGNMNHLSSVMIQNDETEHQPESDRRNHKQVDGGNTVVGVVPQESQPFL